MLIVAVASSSFAGAAAAQDAGDVQAAAAAFSEAQRAQLRGDYARAAELFEVADQSAPSAPARRSAIRNHRAAEQHARAATLAAEALTAYPEDAETRALAEEVLAELRPALGRVDVRCESSCALALDGRAAWHEPVTTLELYVDPGAHRLVASFSEGGDDEREITLEAGASESVAFAPSAVAQPEPDAEPTAPSPIDPPAPSGLHPAIFGVAAGLTAVGLGLTIWSGVDTLAARDAYVANPTQQGYEDGVSLEWRTNGLLFGTIGLGIASAVHALFTDFGGGSIVTAFAPIPGGAYAGISGTIEGWR